VDLKEPQEPKDLLELPDPKVSKALPELPVLKVFKELQVLLVHKGPLDWQGLLDLTEPMEPTEYRPTKPG
jgi:hypothetical protein